MGRTSGWVLATATLLGACIEPGGIPPDPDAGHGAPRHDAGPAYVPPDAGRDAGLHSTALRAPSLGGGTLIALRDGAEVAAASAELDRVYFAHLVPPSVTRVVDLPAGSEAGRLVEDGTGRVHVVLRRGRGIATIDPITSAVTLRPVCAAPRGIAWRESDDALVVACAEGLLVTLPAAGGDATQVASIDDDLRDVVISGDQVLVSRFRSAEVLSVDRDGHVVHRFTPPTWEGVDTLVGFADPAPTAQLVPHVAWRMIPAPGGAWLLHQRHRVTAIPASLGLGGSGASYYGASSFGGSPIVHTVVTYVDASFPADASSAPPGVPTSLGLATDLAASEGGEITVVSSESTDQRSFGVATITVGAPEAWHGSDMPLMTDLTSTLTVGTTHVYLQRDPAVLTVAEPGTVGFPTLYTLVLDSSVTNDAGHRAFHAMTSSGLACASCHPEGGDDGHVWHFGESAAVRTQSLVGGVMSTAPFHWEGDLADFSALIDEVYTVRMGGARGALDAPALASWLGALPVPERPTLDGLGRGRALFESAEVGCADCHSGPQLTNGQTVDVGTGGAFQVPRLVGLGLHAPFLHSGCAATLRERFTADASCTGGDQHGHISGLTPSDVDDLVAYLSSL